MDLFVNNVVLADDDKDDLFLFERALKDVSPNTRLTSIADGEKLMRYLSENIKDLPEVIFLDLNMPRKNGSECLTIKQNKKLKQVPIIIYSTSFHDDILELLYKYGASYCIRKPTDSTTLNRVIKTALDEILKNRSTQPGRENFLLNLSEAN
jgi:CheY-like chemotaxis protein